MMRRVGLTVVWMVAAVSTVAVAVAQDWSWPEKAENLQKLPEDFSAQRLRAVMTGFTRALGVRCSYCHVGEEGQPLSTYDFASDDNPKKQTARVMLDLLGAVNDHLDEIEPSGPGRVNMWCHTCHAGRPRPTTVREEFNEVYEAEGVAAALSHVSGLREEFHGQGTLNFAEGALNAIGYQLLGQDKYDEAIAVFRRNTEYFPESGNVWDSLAEAYLARGDREQAIVYYQKSLALAPDNVNAVNKLRDLRKPAE